MHPDTLAFLDALFLREDAQHGFITLTAINKAQVRPFAPSRHIQVTNRLHLLHTLEKLQQTNEAGWDALVGIALRQADLGRWKRGSVADLYHLPSLFIDIDQPFEQTHKRIRCFTPKPSIIINSGFGTHLYWHLLRPTTSFRAAQNIMEGLAASLDADFLTVDYSMRIPGMMNHKRRQISRIIEMYPTQHPLTAFSKFTIRKDMPTTEPMISSITLPNVTRKQDSFRKLNPDLINVITSQLISQYAGKWNSRRGWLDALCPCGHTTDKPGKHFGWNPSAGVGRCFGRHGRLLAYQICRFLGINPDDYGGIFA